MTDRSLASLHSGEVFPRPADQPANHLNLPKPTKLPAEESIGSIINKTNIEKEGNNFAAAIIESQGTVDTHRLKSKKELRRTKLRPKDNVKDVLNELGTKTSFDLTVLSSTLPSTYIPMSSTRLFVASLGNPAPYLSTRHSAGHVLIKALQTHLLLPTFHKSKPFANGLVSSGAEIGRPEYTLWQSPSLMNVSGVALLQAYKTFTSTTQMSATDPLPGLVVIYDEMETSPGQLRIRRGPTSAKGHNGLKSVQQSLQSAGLMSKLGDRYIKVGIGIGRPAGGSRSSGDVSQYVLSQLTGNEKQTIDGKAGELVRLLEVEMARMEK